jgi:hypothetical protein
MFVVSEVLTNSIPAQPLTHLIPLELCFFLYLPIVYITSSTQGFYVLKFLDPENPALLAGGIIAIIAAIIIMFLVIRGIAYSKLYLLRSRGRTTGHLARRDPKSYRNMDTPLETFRRQSQSKYEVTETIAHLA